MLQDNLLLKHSYQNSPEPFTSKGIAFTATISPGMGSRDGLSCTEILLYTSVEIIEVIAPVSINISALTLFTLTGKYNPASTTRFETCLCWFSFFRGYFLSTAPPTRFTNAWPPVIVSLYFHILFLRTISLDLSSLFALATPRFRFRILYCTIWRFPCLT